MHATPGEMKSFRLSADRIALILIDQAEKVRVGTCISVREVVCSANSYFFGMLIYREYEHEHLNNRGF